MTAQPERPPVKIPFLLTSFALAFLTGCAGQTARPERPENHTAAVDWDKVTRDVDDILKPRAVKGPIQNRGQAETGQQLWDLSLQQELTIDASEGDKARGRDYVRAVAEKAKQLDRLAKCKGWQLLCKRRARRAPAD